MGDTKTNVMAGIRKTTTLPKCRIFCQCVQQLQMAEARERAVKGTTAVLCLAITVQCYNYVNFLNAHIVGNSLSVRFRARYTYSIIRSMRLTTGMLNET
jgi:hypothetical protein